MRLRVVLCLLVDDDLLQRFQQRFGFLQRQTNIVWRPGRPVHFKHIFGVAFALLIAQHQLQCELHGTLLPQTDDQFITKIVSSQNRT